MILTGISDEAGAALDAQIRATQELGWRFIEARSVEVPGHAKENLHELDDAAFEIVARALEAAGVGVYCFSSAIMNWTKRVEMPFHLTQAEVRRTIPRMQRLGTRLVRIMSYKPGDEDYRIPAEVFRRVKDVTNMFLDAGLQPVHENCMNHGGMSRWHALELLDRCPGLRWAFDTGNPLFNPDRSQPRPWPKQDPWEFWVAVRDHVAHIHIKDVIWNVATQYSDYHWPGEGHGRVRDILRDALARGYDAGIAIEPHMVRVFHDADTKPDPEAQFRNYVEYGQRLEAILNELAAQRAAAVRPSLVQP